MKTVFKRMGAIIISLCIVLSVVIIPSTAAGYVSNWGQREVLCTSLSSYAENYYKGSAAIATLAANAGGSGQSDAPSSALYRALQNMMKSKRTYTNNYTANNTLLRYTDCINGDSSKISSFYSGTLFNSAWDSAATWNKEHTWPKSKCINTSNANDSADVMMIRPTIVSENSDRGNKAYGKTNTNYIYNPNSESNGQFDVRGDCARICLYQYTYWGNTSKMWGSYGVMESLDTLIEWMIADPVDTWEMGRNDSVQSITGVRNVFVDYPELAFKLFGYQVPAGYKSPSGLGNSIGGSAVITPPTSSKVTNVLDQVVGGNTSGTTSTSTNSTIGAITNNTSSTKVDTSKDYDVDINECRHEVTIHKNAIPATCEKAGMTAELLCDQCGLYISAGTEIPKLTHKPGADGVTCEYCGKDFTKIEIDLGDNEGNNNLTLYLIIGGVVLLVAAGVIITIVVVKKKKATKAEQDFNLN